MPLAGDPATSSRYYGEAVAPQRRWAAGITGATAVDLATVIALAAVALVEMTVTVGQYSVHDRFPVAVVTGLAACCALFWRRRRPLLVCVFALVVLTTAFEYGVTPQAWLVPYVLVLAYSAGAYDRGWESIAGLVTTLVIGQVIAAHAADTPQESSPADHLFTVAVCGAAWLAGYAWRRRHDQAAADRQAAVLAERARIARELHDVVAHSLGVIAIQSDAAEQALAHEPKLVAAPLRAIRETSTEALAEMRRLVGLLRVDQGTGPPPPQPGLEQLGTLIEEVRATGMPVTFDLTGGPAQVPPGLELAVYRIVQEALTNAQRHAGPAVAVHVHARIDNHDVRLEVIDAGPRRDSPHRDGHGLLGMRERVALYDGDFEAGPCGEGGFRVRARLPIPSDRR
jgi:signal transduction histidine kinase